MQSMAEDPYGRIGPLFDSAVRSQLEFVLTSELFGDHQMVRLGRLAQWADSIGSQLNVSRDGRWALLAQQQLQTDLVLVENFK
jgi:hypothetical protein